MSVTTTPNYFCGHCNEVNLRQIEQQEVAERAA